MATAMPSPRHRNFLYVDLSSAAPYAAHRCSLLSRPHSLACLTSPASLTSGRRQAILTQLLLTSGRSMNPLAEFSSWWVLLWLRSSHRQSCQHGCSPPEHQLAPEPGRAEPPDHACCIYMTVILVTFLSRGISSWWHSAYRFPGSASPGEWSSDSSVPYALSDEGQISTEGKEEAQEKLDISFSPLAMPSLSGPGSLAVVITMSSSIDVRHGIDKILAFAGVILAILLTASFHGSCSEGQGPCAGFSGSTE